MTKEVLTTTEAASFLSMSQNQIYKLNAAGKIPSYRPTGGKVFYLKEELIEWILSSRRATVKDINFKTIKSFNSKN